jgi:hypothetical protein
MILQNQNIMETKKGISTTGVLLIILVILVVGMFCYIVFTKKTNSPIENQPVQMIPEQNVDTNADQDNLKIDESGTTATNTDDNIVSPQVPIVDQSACNTGYDKTTESKVVSEESSTLITGFEKKCDGNYYLTFDYIGQNVDNLESGVGDPYKNESTKLRTYKVDSTLQVGLAGMDEEVPLAEYLGSLTKSDTSIYGQKNAYVNEGAEGQAVFHVVIEKGIVVSMSEETN